MVFTKEDVILIKVLRQSNSYSARKLLAEFPDKDWFVQHWTDFCDRLTLHGLVVYRQEVRQQQRTYGLHKRHANVCANGDHFEHKL